MHCITISMKSDTEDQMAFRPRSMSIHQVAQSKGKVQVSEEVSQELPGILNAACKLFIALLIAPWGNFKWVDWKYLMSNSWKELPIATIYCDTRQWLFTGHLQAFYLVVCSIKYLLIFIQAWYLKDTLLILSHFIIIYAHICASCCYIQHNSHWQIIFKPICFIILLEEMTSNNSEFHVVVCVTMYAVMPLDDQLCGDQFHTTFTIVLPASRWQWSTYFHGGWLNQCQKYVIKYIKICYTEPSFR